MRPFLDRGADVYLFSPKEAYAWHCQHRQANGRPRRKTPVYPSELRARERAKMARRGRKPKRPKRSHYDTDSYRRAIAYGFRRARKAGVVIPHWHPNQLRHRHRLAKKVIRTKPLEETWIDFCNAWPRVKFAKRRGTNGADAC